MAGEIKHYILHVFFLCCLPPSYIAYIATCGTSEKYITSLRPVSALRVHAARCDERLCRALYMV